MFMELYCSSLRCKFGLMTPFWLIITGFTILLYDYNWLNWYNELFKNYLTS